MASRHTILVVYDHLNAIWVLGLLACSVFVATLGCTCYTALEMICSSLCPLLHVRDHPLCELTRLSHVSCADNTDGRGQT